MNNCTVVNNAATFSSSQGGGVYYGTVNNSIVWDNTAQQSGSDLAGAVVNSSCAPGYGFVSPQFVGGGDYHLQSSSPCIDAGSALYVSRSADLDGIPLPLDGDNTGTATVDIGCYEYVHATADSDGDTLSDQDELNIYGTDPTNTNSDGDPQSDGDEYIAATDPSDPDDYFRITAISGSAPCTLYFASSALRNYTLLGCTNLTEGAWQPLSGPRTGVDGPDSITDSGSASARFYKLQVELP